jgi:hypothetical protein
VVEVGDKKRDGKILAVGNLLIRDKEGHAEATVRVEVSDPDETLVPGMDVWVQVHTTPLTRAAYAPRGTYTGTTLLVLNKEGRLEARECSTVDDVPDITIGEKECWAFVGIKETDWVVAQDAQYTTYTPLQKEPYPTGSSVRVQLVYGLGDKNWLEETKELKAGMHVIPRRVKLVPKE